MATKQEVADYINSVDTQTIWTDAEIAYVQQKMDPHYAEIMIKLLGDVSFLIEVRDNASN
jgi:hypothetical protein